MEDSEKQEFQNTDKKTTPQKKNKVWWQRASDFFLKYPIISSLLPSLAAGMVWMVYVNVSHQINWRYPHQLIAESLLVVLMGIIITYPFVLTALNLVFLLWPRRRERLMRAGKRIGFLTVPIGVVCNGLYLTIDENIRFSSDYSEQLYNQQLHTPIFTQAQPTILVLGILAAVGCLVLRVVPLRKQPPLLTVLSLATLYPGMALCVVFDLQIWGLDNLFLMLLPLNLVLIWLKVIKETVWEWKRVHPADDETQFGGKKWLLTLNRLLCRACGLPVAALVLAVPLLGVVIGILTLCGQTPDAVIQAWTQTADWTFSQQTAPPNVMMDEHYLCTVAAGGHRRMVKPLRTGRRHGHEVIVNRQLCVANAFEQLLEERTPRLHRAVRGIYDRCGYPVARHIRTKAAADIVYFLMKPLEWLFLAVLYLCDVRPENRIAVQYPHAPLPAMRERSI